MKLTDDNLAIIEMKKVKVKMNKPIYLGLSILDMSKITMYEFWYDFIKSKYGCSAKLCYMDTDSFIINVKTEIFIRIYQRTLLKGLILLIIFMIGHYLGVLIRKC